MFDRDWKKKEDYSDIAEYSSAMQAWEFLRRKPTYQIDCRIINEFHSWIKTLLSTDVIDHLTVEINNRLMTGKRLVKKMQKPEGHFPSDIEEGLKNLSADDVKKLYQNQKKPVFWLLPRHDLSDWLDPMPPMPSENSPEGIEKLFLPLNGGQIVVPHQSNKSYKFRLPPAHAAVIINLNESIPQQLEGLADRLEKQCRAEMDKSKIRKGTLKEIPAYIQLLDALTERQKEETYRELYEVLDPIAYKKNQNSEKLEKAANAYIGARKKKAQRLRDSGYNLIANNSPKHSFIESL